MTFCVSFNCLCLVRPLIAYTNPKLDTIVGRDVRLTCIVLLGNPAPRISWLKMGEVINPKDYTLEDAGGTLIIKDVQVSDEGEYTCVASNVGGNATYVTVLDVQGMLSFPGVMTHNNITIPELQLSRYRKYIAPYIFYSDTSLR